MIKKEREKPKKVMQLEALLRRLPSSYSKLPYIEAELGKVMAGWRGEQAIDFHLSFLPKEDYTILHALRLEDSEGRFFQMDTVLLSLKFHVILEVKNMAGTLYVNHAPQQLVQIYNNEEKAYPCAILQVERQRLQLQAFFKKFKLPDVPILSLVVISNSNTVIKIAPNYHKARQCVIHTPALPVKISAIQEVFKDEKLSQKELKKTARLLISKHQPLIPNYLERFQIPPSDILTGVHCPKCRHLPMERIRGKWLCPSCRCLSKDAHIVALHDYFLLINPTITNQQLRDFLHLPSIKVASKILTAQGLSKFGKFKDSRYGLE